MRHGYLWPIERIDANGEPAASGSYIKIGFREAGAARTIWIDAIDAEALIAGLSALVAGKPADPPGAACEACAKALAPGCLAYHGRPGAPTLLCEACAPTVSEETSKVVAELERAPFAPGARPAGFASRAAAVSWVNRTRGAFHVQTKRLEPLRVASVPPIEADIQFKEPPAESVAALDQVAARVRAILSGVPAPVLTPQETETLNEGPEDDRQTEERA